MRRSSSTTGPTWATRWSCTTDARRALISAEHQGRAGTEGFRPALLRLCFCLCLCLWPRWCSGRRRARPLCVPVGGGPPASRPRRELRSARRLEARPGPATAHRHRGRSLRRPPHRRRLWFWCARPGPAAAHRHRGLAVPPPTGAAARLSGASSRAAAGCDVRA